MALSFLFYDLVFLIVFTIWVVWFLYTRKHNLKREGIIYLYRTKLGIRFINYVGKKYKKAIKVLRYFSVLTGFILMIGILGILSLTLYTYLRFPQITQVVKAPPILPLIPYFPSIFGLQSFFPPLYFTYWIIAILIVAAVHEFSHGIFAKYHGLKIKSTGFAFLGPILGAFVEPDEKAMFKKGKFAQMSILSAGVFANIITAAVFTIFLWVTFLVAFQPGGVIIAGYPSAIIEISSIQEVNGAKFNNDFNGFLTGELTEIKTKENNFIIQTEALEKQLSTYNNSVNKIAVFLDAPAVRNNIQGVIVSIGDEEVKTREELTSILSKHLPGDKVSIKTKINGNATNYEIILSEHPTYKGTAFLGISSYQEGGPFNKFMRKVLSFRDPSISYEEKNTFFVFIYYLLWWIVMINFFVALFNMLPIGILDGGRFFQLTIFWVTKSEKSSILIYKLILYLILFLFLAILFSYLTALL